MIPTKSSLTFFTSGHSVWFKELIRNALQRYTIGVVELVALLALECYYSSCTDLLSGGVVLNKAVLQPRNRTFQFIWICDVQLDYLLSICILAYSTYNGFRVLDKDMIKFHKGT